MQVPQITYKAIQNHIDPNANLQKAQVYLNAQALPITVEKVTHGYMIRAELLDGTRFDRLVSDKDVATAAIRGVVFDRILAAMEKLTPEDIKPEVKEETPEPATEQPNTVTADRTRVEWRFNKGKYRVYTPGSTRQLIAFEGGLQHLHNWAKKHTEYEVINKLPVIKPVKKKAS